MGAIIENERKFTVESIVQTELEKVLTDYDNKLFICLQKKDYKACEQYLSDFCFAILDMSEEKQVFVARIFFVSIVTDLIRLHNRKLRLHPRTLSKAYEIIKEIETWENISEYILSIKWMVEEIAESIIGDYIVMDGCKHINKAVRLIEKQLKGDMITVKWLAKQLGISSTHLNNLFKLQAGETVASFITKRKMNEIVYEIAYTNQSLKVIREKYGYFNHSHFIQHFKKYYGITPLQYKQQMYRI